MNLLNSKEIQYHGKVDFDDFHLGKIINDSRVGRSVGSLILEGSGSNAKTMNLNMFVQLEDFIFSNKTYQNVHVVLNKQSNNYKFSFNANDRDLKMRGKGVYIHQRSPQLEAEIAINHAN